MPVIAGLKRETIVIDAEGKIVGRLATQIANKLMGKDKPTYTPHIDAGASIKVINASKLVYSGKKMDQKVLFRSSNRPSGIKRLPVAKLQVEKPGEILRHAVKYMLPKNRTQAERMNRLTIEA
ncbi:MAG: large subunit ribosomal protein [Patescibacteria group bacterium]|nr:large subunit ribosomal protein [Patescibacteria group bacterium]